MIEKNYPVITNARFVDAFGLTRAMFVSHALALMDASNALSRADLFAACWWATEESFNNMQAITTQEGIFAVTVGKDDLLITVNETELAKRIACPSSRARTRGRAELVSLRLDYSLILERERDYIYNTLSLSKTISLDKSKREPFRTHTDTPAREEQPLTITPVAVGGSVPVAEVFGPLSPLEVRTLSASYGVASLEAACLKAHGRFPDRDDAKWARRFSGFVTTCLANEFPNGNPNAAMQNATRQRKETAATVPKEARASPVSEAPTDKAALVASVRSIREQTGLNTISKPVEAYLPDAPKTPKKHAVNSGMSQIKFDAVKAEMEQKSRARVDAWMETPTIREGERQ